MNTNTQVLNSTSRTEFYTGQVYIRGHVVRDRFVSWFLLLLICDVVFFYGFGIDDMIFQGAPRGTSAARYTLTGRIEQNANE